MSPKPYRYLSDMPNKTRAALERCSSSLVYVGKHADHNIATRTLNVLRERGLIIEARDKRSKRIWRPSVAGVELLTREEPRLLAARSQRGYVTPSDVIGMGNGEMFAEPEPVDDAYQRFLTADAHERERGLPGRRRELLEREATQLSRRLRFEARRCDPGSDLVVAQLERIRAEVDRLEGLRAA